MNADGTNVVKITGRETYDATPAWSPDGTKIAFTRWGGGGHDDIYVMILWDRRYKCRQHYQRWTWKL